MAHDVNPFEPWRPRGTDAGGEDVYPWRTPPRDEALPGPEDREVPHWQRRGKAVADEPDPVPPPTGANTFCTLLLIVLVIGTLIAVGNSGGGHFWRYVSVSACAWLGVFVGLSRMYRDGWLARLGVVAAGVGAAAGCFLFVPTSGGTTWWAARNELAAVASIPEGDVAAFRAGQGRRDALRREFRGWDRDIDRAEREWVGRLVSGLPAEIEAAAKADADKALARLLEVERGLASSPHRGAFQGPMHRVWEGAVKARLAEITKAADGLAARGLYLRAHEDAQEAADALQKRIAGHFTTTLVRDEVLRLRERLLDQHLREGEKTLNDLLKEGKHEAVGREGRRLAADLAQVAAPLRRAGEVVGRLARPRGEAALALAEAVRTEAAGHLAGNDPDKAAEVLASGSKGLEAEARAAGVWVAMVTDAAPLRKRVLGVRVARAEKDIEALLDKKEHEKAGAAARAAFAALAGEARELDEITSVEVRFLGLRQRALRARLDAAREALQALLVKEEFEGAGRVADETEAALRAEADALGRRKELDEFVSRCRAIARLAAAAKKKE